MSKEIANVYITLSGGSANTLDEAALEIESLARKLATKRGLSISVVQETEEYKR